MSAHERLSRIQKSVLYLQFKQLMYFFPEHPGQANALYTSDPGILVFNVPAEQHRAQTSLPLPSQYGQLRRDLSFSCDEGDNVVKITATGKQCKWGTRGGFNSLFMPGTVSGVRCLPSKQGDRQGCTVQLGN